MSCRDIHILQFVYTVPVSIMSQQHDRAPIPKTAHVKLQKHLREQLSIQSMFNVIQKVDSINKVVIITLKAKL